MQENFPIEPNDMLAEDKKYFKFFRIMNIIVT